MRETLRLRHYSIHTEETYLSTIKRFVEFHGRRHPEKMGVQEIRAYLSHLAIEQNVAPSTQNVAFNALLFLYRDVLKIELPKIENVERAQKPSKLPVVFTQQEAKAILANLTGTPRLMASLLYGSGLRLMECLRACESAYAHHVRSSRFVCRPGAQNIRTLIRVHVQKLPKVSAR